MANDRILALLQIEFPYRRVRFWLALLGFTLFLLIALGSFHDWTGSPEWGIAVKSDGDVLRVAWVQPSSAAWMEGVRSGDVIIEANGSRVNTLDPAALPQLSTIKIVSQKTGSASLLTARPALDLSLVFSLFASGMIFVIIGSSVLLWAPRIDEALAFYGLSSISAIVFALAIAEPEGQLWNVRLLFAATILSASSQACFFLVFPKNRLLKHAPASYFILFSPASLLIILFVLASLKWQFLYEMLRPIAYSVHGSLYLIAVGAFLWNFIELRREGAAGRLVVPIIGTLAAVVGTVVTTILPLGLASKPLIPPEMGALFQVFIPASFAYAILRHRLLGLSGIIRRALINFFVGVALLASFAALSAVVNRTVEPNWDYQLMELAVQVVFVAVALIVLPALHGASRRFVDRVFFRDVYEYDKALQSITRILASARSADALASDVTAILTDTLNLTFAAVILRDVGGQSEVIAVTPDASSYVMKDVQAIASSVLSDSKPQALFSGKACGVDVTYVPLVSGGIYAGLLCLGPKQSGLSLSQRDVNLLTNVATQLAMGLDNARLLRTVQRNFAELQASAAKLRDGQRLLRELNHRLLMTEEKERRRLAADLHDEPLQSIMMLLRHIDGCPSVRKAKNGVCKDLAAQAAATLRRVCVDFHPPLLEDLGLEAALDWLVSNTDKSSSITARIEVDPEFNRRQLRPEAQIALYRVVQEALNNTLRHSQATSVLVRLSAAVHEVVVTVKDDGNGFQMPESLSNLSIDGHMGLIGMRERMESVGGRLEIFTEPGAGTEVSAILKCETKGGSRAVARMVTGAVE